MKNERTVTGFIGKVLQNHFTKQSKFHPFFSEARIIIPEMSFNKKGVHMCPTGNS